MQAADLVKCAINNVCRLFHVATCFKAHLQLTPAPAAVMCSLQEITPVPNKCVMHHKCICNSLVDRYFCTRGMLLCKVAVCNV